MGIVDYLQNQTGKQDLQEPAMLFSQSNKDAKFPDIFLFSNFGYCTSNNISARSEITNNYVEDNVSFQDHWALPPIEYTLSGVVGEIVYIPPVTWANFLQEKVTHFLDPLGIISPTISSYTQSAINIAKQIEFTVQRYGQIARNVYSSLGGNVNKNVISNQQYIYELLMNLRNNRHLVSVYTPYGELHSMAITSISMRQNESVFQSTIEVRLQQWLKVSELQSRQATASEKQIIVDMQKARETKNAYSGKERLVSYLKKLKEGLTK